MTTPDALRARREAQDDAPILTVDEAAALLRVKPLWLQRSDCPRDRKGRIVRYRRDRVLAWWTSNEDAA